MALLLSGVMPSYFLQGAFAQIMPYFNYFSLLDYDFIVQFLVLSLLCLLYQSLKLSRLLLTLPFK